MPPRPPSRPVGVPTRGTTHPQRLRRVDRWITATQAARLRAAADPLVVDLGFGARPTTTVELAARLRTVRPDVRVVGVEIDAGRVAAAQGVAGPGLSFVTGGFELAGLRPVLVRAMNVLRQYGEDDVPAAWSRIRDQLAPDGVLVEGTCDELGRVGTWLEITRDDAVPRLLVLSVRLASLERPGAVAARLPKALIHRNVPGEPVHAFLAAADAAWDRSSRWAAFGPRVRWQQTAADLRSAGWPLADRQTRWRHGELAVGWPAVAPLRSGA